MHDYSRERLAGRAAASGDAALIDTFSRCLIHHYVESSRPADDNGVNLFCRVI